MHLVRMWETRFDPSPNYEERKAQYGGVEPLAWAALFRKPVVVGGGDGGAAGASGS